MTPPVLDGGNVTGALRTSRGVLASPRPWQWTPTTYDSHNALSSLVACVDDKGTGQFNLGAYCNPKVDELTKKIQSETDKTKRDAMIKEAFTIHADDVGHLPLHQQSLAWGVSKKVELTQLADNWMMFKWMSIKP